MSRGTRYPSKQRCQSIEIIDIECGLLSRLSQKIVATKWRIYKGKMSSPQGTKWRIYKGKFSCQIGPLSRDRARILYVIILCVKVFIV